MNTKELLKEVRKIEIKTKGLSNHIFSGEYHSAFKGRGMAFSEVRNYQSGDEIRTIDWNVTARFNEPFVKVFEEERELTVMLLVDFSASQHFGIRSKTKREVLTEISAVLSFSTISNNDKIGLIIFTEEVELFIPPKKGKKHTLRIIRELIDFTPQKKGTNITEALKYFSRMVKKKSIAFVLSDFNDDNFLKSIQVNSKKHDIIGLRIIDSSEFNLPNIGIAEFLDSETGETYSINTNSKKIRKQYFDDSQAKNKEIELQLKKSGIDFETIDTDEDYVKPLIKIFNKRT